MMKGGGEGSHGKNRFVYLVLKLLCILCITDSEVRDAVHATVGLST